MWKQNKIYCYPPFSLPVIAGTTLLETFAIRFRLKGTVRSKFSREKRLITQRRERIVLLDSSRFISISLTTKA